MALDNLSVDSYMITFVLGCIMAFALGSIAGKKLASRGINSDNALKNHQKPLVWLLCAIAPFLGILIFLDKNNLISLLPQIFPPILLIYIAGYFNQVIVMMGCGFLGLLLFLELAGKRSGKKVLKLLLALGAIASA